MDTIESIGKLKVELASYWCCTNWRTITHVNASKYENACPAVPGEWKCFYPAYCYSIGINFDPKIRCPDEKRSCPPAKCRPVRGLYAATKVFIYPNLEFALRCAHHRIFVLHVLSADMAGL